MLILIDAYLTGRNCPDAMLNSDGVAVCPWWPASSSDWWNHPEKTPDDVMEAYHRRPNKTRFEKLLHDHP